MHIVRRVFQRELEVQIQTPALQLNFWVALHWREVIGLVQAYFPYVEKKYLNANKNDEILQRGLLGHSLKFEDVSDLRRGFLESCGKQNVFVDSHHPRHSMKSDLNLENLIIGK